MMVRGALARGRIWSRQQLAQLPYRLGRYPIGQALLVRLLGWIPDRGTAADIKGKILWSLNDRAGALTTVRRALERTPGDPELVASMAGMEVQTGAYGDAEARVRSVLDRSATEVPKATLLQLANALTYALLHQRKAQDAWDLVSGGVAARLPAERIAFLQAHICRYTRRYDEAEDLYRKVLSQRPDDLLARFELAELLSLRGTFIEAEAIHHDLMRLTGDPAFNARNHSHTLLAQGRVREGWARNMLRVENSELKRVKGVRVWDGSDLAGRSIFVIVEGGTGDELRDAVCYGDLSQRAAQVTVACDPRLETLLRRSFPKVKTWPVGRAERVSGLRRRLSRLMDDATLEQARRHDLCVVSPDLFYVFKPSPEDYGKPSPYLVPNPALVAQWRERLAALGPGPKIGIAWSTIRQTYRTFSYYTKLADWRPIFTFPGAVFVNLQYGDCIGELMEAEQKFGVRIHRWPELDLLNDFESVAALMVALDLVLAPNSTTLELAGALGARAWYMVNEYQTLDHFRRKDLNTGQDRCYPSVRIFMARQPGDAASLIDQVGAELHRTFGAPNVPAPDGTSAAPAPS